MSKNSNNDEPVIDKTITSWDDLDLKSELLRGIYAYGFEKPSPIQKKSILPILNGRDVLAQAQSGTGKTACFTISSLQIVDIDVNSSQVIIMSPTRELSCQIKSVVDQIGINIKNLHTQLLVGGTSTDVDTKLLKENTPHIIIGCPGRINDMLKRKNINQETIKLVILDEADEMLSSGFKEQMYKIFQYTPNEIQIGLFSATMPTDLQELTDKFLRNPVKILVKAEQLTLQGIAQYFINLEDDLQKYECIKDLFSSLTVSQAIIYCNSTRRVDDLEEAMTSDNFPVKKIHGKMPDEERKKTHKDFKSGGCRVLITSDLFARGIDVQQVSIVINFDIPKNEHTYLHRIGRSGRWGRKGIAINFQTKHDATRLKKFEDYYCTQIEEMPANYTEHLGLN